MVGNSLSASQSHVCMECLKVWSPLRARGNPSLQWWSKQATSEQSYGGSFSDGIGHIFLIAKLFSVICSSVHPDQYNGPYSNILKFMPIQVKYRFLLSSDLKKKVSQAILCGSMCVSVFLCVIFLSNA